jgi:pimeloyl-ACP methyl ester carboxylesterase
MTRSVLLCLATVALLAAQETPAPPAPSAPVEQVLRPPEPGRFKALFQRFRTENAALSPDGRHLAYSVLEEDTVYVVVVDLDRPDIIKTRVKVVDDRAATLQRAANQREDNPGRILWLRWVTSNRVVVGTNEVSLRGTGAVLAFDADGGNARKLADPGDLLPNPTLGKEFSTTRQPQFLLPTPDQKKTGLANEENPDTADEELASFDLALPAADEGTAPPGETPDPGELQPRSLQIFDLDAQRPGAVSLVSVGPPRGNGTHWLEFHSLDTRTGKLTDLANAQVTDSEAVLLDRQGRQRLTLPNTTRYDFPFRYAYLGPKGGSRAKPLDEAFKLTGFSLSPGNYFGERALPLGFDEDPNLLYYAANLGRDTYGIYSLNLTTGQRGALTMEHPVYDLIGPPESAFPGSETLVFDRYTHQLAGVRFQTARRTASWLRPEWQAVQTELERALPGRTVDLLEWDEAGRRFLLSTENPADPGAFHVYDRAGGKLTEVVRRAPWIDANHTYQTIPFGFTLADGVRVSGFVAVPTQPRMKPIPMIILCPDTPWTRVEPGYDRDVHALAGMGFVVVQLNGRGAWGGGRRQREAITAGYDRVQVEDLVATVGALSARFLVNPKRVALLGRGHGGFIALRAVQEHPDKFRCAVTLEPPVDIAEWLASLRWTDEEVVLPHLTRAWLGDAARLQAAPLVSAPEKLTKPILMLSYPGPDGTARRPFYLAARGFAASVRSHGTVVEFTDLHTDYVQGLPGARAEVFDRIEEFLNLHIYDFSVKLREMQIIK